MERRNRQLLFGRPSSNGGQSSSFATSTNRAQAEHLFEQENNQAWEQLHGKAGSLKEIAVQLDEEINSQNTFLNNMTGSFDTVGDLLSGTLSRLNRLASERTGRHMCYLVLFIFAFFVLVYLLFRN
eukprot:jgi/Galph1/3173/GphlegSOOS_G1837.1